MRCRAVLQKSTGLTSEQVGEQTDMTHISVNSRVKRFETEGIKGLETRPGRGRKPIMDCSDEESVRKAIENDRQSVKKAKEAWQQASGGRSLREYLHGFFIRLGAGYRRIRKRPKGKPSPQLYAHKTDKLQELVQQEKMVSSTFIMEMKATSALRNMRYTDGSSAVKMSIFHLKEV
ncbi:hypothetical protein [Barnesiella sp. WM24]|uniref:hypothetical protein n=1 Tax=Barnesiella sp. WM24 TaxID=2558278 RepID=UPI001FD7B0F6|nr:hypothetical protein [Barnesiella sp. WM24]